MEEWGRKEIIGLADGYRESAQSWRELLLDLQRRGLTHAPDLAIGDGALGFWHAQREVFGATKEQRCWFHKTGNVLNAMPKSVQAKAKGHLQGIWQAETRLDPEAAFDFFPLGRIALRCACRAMVTTYGVKYDKAVGKLTKWRKPDGAKRMPEIIEGIAFKDGIKQRDQAAGSRRYQLSGIAQNLAQTFGVPSIGKTWDKIVPFLTAQVCIWHGAELQRSAFSI